AGTFTGGYLFGGSEMIGMANGSGTFSGVLADTAPGQFLSLTKAGSGTQILTGANSYHGGTTKIGGTLQIGDETTSNGSVPGNIGNNTNLVIANPNPQTFLGSITGPGTLTKKGAGTLTLTGANTASMLTVSAGTLFLAGGSLTGLTGIDISAT